MKLQEKITDVDTRLLKKFQKRVCKKKYDKAMVIITKSGNIGLVWAGIAGLLFLTKKHRRRGFVLGTTVGMAGCLNNLILKNISKRPRPCDVDKDAPALISRPFGDSFPSGHALSSFTAATLLMRYKKSYALGALPLATLISLSRMYLNVHYPSDIIGGAAIGVAIGTAVDVCDKKLQSASKAASRSPQRS
ncbi:MAG: phosphatase PAP2 family protein [Eubacterium sp.]|nr:phosphatase PAP2 family protein [Eubacterium sp.]